LKWIIMSLLNVEIATCRADAVEAELWVTATADDGAPGELRGRIVGPRCPGRTTIEVAYPLRPFARKPDGLPALAAQVVIPEPSLWEEAHPFVYDAVVELWHEGICRAQRRITAYPVVKTNKK
jgi:hypothetical protein